MQLLLTFTLCKRTMIQNSVASWGTEDGTPGSEVVASSNCFTVVERTVDHKFVDHESAFP